MMEKMNRPIPGKLYSKQEIENNGWSPCENEPCKTKQGRCNDQCMWAWRNEPDCRFYWTGREKSGEPIYSDGTWEWVRDNKDKEEADRIYSDWKAKNLPDEKKKEGEE